MDDRIQALFGRPDVRAEAPAYPDDIAAVARRLGAPLPQPLLDLWHAADGLELRSVDARLLGPTEILGVIENSWSVDLAGPGWCPLLDDNGSNYIGVCVAGPLAPRVVAFWHDPDRRVVYRDLDGFLSALLALLDKAAASEDCDPAELVFRETPGDYEARAPRTPEDHAAARSLMGATSADPKSDWPTVARLLAAQLLDASNLAEWATLLETGYVVRRDVIARMVTLDDPALRDLLERDRREFEDFSREVERAARAGGYVVGRRSGDALEIDGRSWDLEFYFGRRRIPDVLPRLMAWFADSRDGRNPHDRPGHYMTDL